jgi:hypothetical protein
MYTQIHTRTHAYTHTFTLNNHKCEIPAPKKARLSNRGFHQHTYICGYIHIHLHTHYIHTYIHIISRSSYKLFARTHTHTHTTSPEAPNSSAKKSARRASVSEGVYNPSPTVPDHKKLSTTSSHGSLGVLKKLTAVPSQSSMTDIISRNASLEDEFAELMKLSDSGRNSPSGQICGHVISVQNNSHVVSDANMEQPSNMDIQVCVRAYDICVHVVIMCACLCVFVCVCVCDVHTRIYREMANVSHKCIFTCICTYTHTQGDGKCISELLNGEDVSRLVTGDYFGTEIHVCMYTNIFMYVYIHTRIHREMENLSHICIFTSTCTYTHTQGDGKCISELLDGKEVNRLGTGDYFGEAALIQASGKRTRSVKATCRYHICISACMCVMCVSRVTSGKAALIQPSGEGTRSMKATRFEYSK